MGDSVKLTERESRCFVLSVRSRVCCPRDWFVRFSRAQPLSPWHDANWKNGIDADDETRAYPWSFDDAR